jgi:hypothetical protein
MQQWGEKKAVKFQLLQVWKGWARRTSRSPTEKGECRNGGATVTLVRWLVLRGEPVPSVSKPAVETGGLFTSVGLRWAAVGCAGVLYSQGVGGRGSENQNR